MTFNSLSYFLFLPVVYLFFYLTSDRWRWLVLLSASYGFYATFKAPYLLAVLLMVTSVSYVCGRCMGEQKRETVRTWWLWAGIVAIVTILILLKYLPSLDANTNSCFGLKNSHTYLLISIGVSYYTFQAISYLIDVYWEIEEPETHFGYYALYLAFFPKILQGPIERVGEMLPQLKKKYDFDYDCMRSGILLFIWGLFKKVAVSDNLSFYSDHVYGDVYSFVGLPLIVGTYAYALQIYFDFSGYTDMARGTARLFGITLTENFNNPYLSTSIADFWRRWHISFSRWILDYIFKPLNFAWRRQGQLGTALALIITFFISGIWHGASWGFVVWGLIHGFYLAISTFYRPLQKRMHKKFGLEKSTFLNAWQVFITFNMVSFTWIFFRAESLNDALYVVKNLLNFSDNLLSIKQTGLSKFIVNNVVMMKTRYDILGLLIMFAMVYIVYRNKKINIFEKPIWLRWGVYYALILILIFFGNSDLTSDNFLYFKF